MCSALKLGICVVLAHLFHLLFKHAVKLRVLGLTLNYNNYNYLCKKGKLVRGQVMGNGIN